MPASALHAALLAAHSATEVLERICQAEIHVRRLAAPSAARPMILREPGTHHRAVELVCGGRVLSTADLWFRPHLLPADRLVALAETDTPFGRVVGGLGLRRRTLAARICKVGEPAALEHRAVLSTPAGQDVAEVFERYAWALVCAD